MFDLPGVARVEGGVEALSRVQGDGVLVPGADHTQPAVGVLGHKGTGQGSTHRQTGRHTQQRTSMSPNSSGPPASAEMRIILSLQLKYTTNNNYQLQGVLETSQSTYIYISLVPSPTIKAKGRVTVSDP